VKAIAKTRPAVGLDLVDVDEPSLRQGCVKVRIEKGSVCGTDLHIYNWDAWSSGRIHPPRIVGHEFCGTVVEVASDVTTHHVGDFIASESHIICHECVQCRAGQGHVCTNTVILGVDVDGGFGEFAVIPAENARFIPATVPREVASMLDALGNAVHTVMAGPVEGRTVLITGLGPIGMFAVAVCRALGAARIIATEISPFRIALADRLGADTILNPMKEDVPAALRRLVPGGVDATLEMSGHPSALSLAVDHTRPGGRVSLLGVYPDSAERVDFNQIIFKGLDLQGIVGRRLPETWDQMTWLLTEKALDVTPVITHSEPFQDFERVFETLKRGEAGKIVLDFGVATQATGGKSASAAAP
jgi:threonine 3-dehydrogenase